MLVRGFQSVLCSRLLLLSTSEFRGNAAGSVVQAGQLWQAGRLTDAEQRVMIAHVIVIYNQPYMISRISAACGILTARKQFAL